MIKPIPIETLSFYPIVVYDYKKVKYGPLTRKDAISCLISLVQTIKQALDELHRASLSHNDLRLPNICFNEDYEAVLIDLDSVEPLIRDT